jgi:signal transduction histidine kinase
MKLKKLLWSAPWWRANLEGWLLAAPLLALLDYASRWIEIYPLFQCTVLIAAAAPSLVGLRRQPLAGDRSRVVVLEAIQAMLITSGLIVTGYALAMLFQVESGLVKLHQVPDILVYIVSGAVYLFWRIFRWAWMKWSALRERSFAWALTHSFLVVVSGLVIFTVILLVLFMNLASLPTVKEGAPVGVEAFMKLAGFLFFVLLAAPFALLPVLLVLLPPMAGASYWVSRRIARRLERLEAAAARLSRGDWSSRVQPEGADEIARLQTSFNYMAEELEKTNRTILEQRDQLSRALRAQRELTSSVSHELRTPVATALAYLEHDLDRLGSRDAAPFTDDQALSPDSLRQDLEIARHEIERLQGLIDDLFALSKAEINQLSLEMRAVDLAPLAAGAVAAAAGLAWEKRRVQVQLAEVPTGLPPVWADASRVEQVLRNLLSNGVRHTPPGGFVVVSLESGEGWVRTAVTDSGEGIRPEELAHIWERFYRGSDAAAAEAPAAPDVRSGLGLTIVKELVESMGGAVQVESEPDQGSTFSFCLKMNPPTPP